MMIGRVHRGPHHGRIVLQVVVVLGHASHCLMMRLHHLRGLLLKLVWRHARVEVGGHGLRVRILAAAETLRLLYFDLVG